jgi:hypothetical protein
MDGCISIREITQDFINFGLSYVYQHVCVRKPFHRAHLLSLVLEESIGRLSAVVIIKNLLVCDRSNAIVVKF